MRNFLPTSKRLQRMHMLCRHCRVSSRAACLPRFIAASTAAHPLPPQRLSTATATTALKAFPPSLVSYTEEEQDLPRRAIKRSHVPLGPGIDRE